MTLGLTIPLTLVLTAVGGLALQREPLEKFAFRAYEALARGPGNRGSLFVSGRSYRNERSFGDLANIANLPSLRQYRLETFTTDRWGYRNPESAFRDPVAILIGDSFGIGSGEQDSQTLPAHLARLWGRHTYNASGMRPANDVAQVRAIAGMLGMGGGLVIHEFLERQAMPTIPLRAGPVARPSQEVLAETVMARIEERIHEFWKTCRLRILAERIYRRAQNGWFLPNPFRSGAVARRFPDGREILFLPSDLENRARRREVSADYWRWLQRELGKDGLRLVVLLVPNKYTVYGPLLASPAPAEEPGVNYLKRLEVALRNQGIAVVNLELPLQARAREELARGSYLYWLDDAHWNGLGMEVAAGELVRAVPNPGARTPDRAPE